MTFLRLLSKQVRQEIVYHCKNSAAYNGAQSINLQGENDVDINMGSPTKYRPRIIEDGCQVRYFLDFMYMFVLACLPTFHPKVFVFGLNVYTQTNWLSQIYLQILAIYFLNMEGFF